MENLNNSADSAPKKTLKGRKSNARKSRKKKFTRPKRRGERHSKVASHQQQLRTTCQSDDQDTVEQMRLGCISEESDCSPHNADVVNISGYAELPPDDEGRVKSFEDNNAVKDLCDGNTSSFDKPHRKTTENALMTSGEIDTNVSPASLADASINLDGNTQFCDKPQPKTLKNTTLRDTSREMITEGVYDCSALVEIRMDDADSVITNRVKTKTTLEADSPSGERFTATLVPPGPLTIPSVGQFRYSVRDETKALLERVCRQLMTSLPSLWLPVVKTDGTHVGLFAEDASFVIQRSLFVAPDGAASVTVHGRELPPDHCYWNNVKTVPLTPDSVDHHASNVLQMVRALASLELCTGVEQFEHLWQCAVDCEVDSNLYHEKHYEKSCRSTACPFLFEKGKKSRCEACSRVFRIFSHREKRRLNRATDVPAKFAANCYLTASEQRELLRTKNAQLRAERQRNSRLRDKLNKLNALVAEEGLQVDGDTADDVTKILETAT